LAGLGTPAAALLRRQVRIAPRGTARRGRTAVV